MKILCIAAHPDDIELAMSGTLMKHNEKGDETHVAVCCLGNMPEIFKQREDEAREGASILKVTKLHSLNYSVFKLNKLSTEFEKLIKKTIEEINPDRLYVHSPFDYHQVHVTVNKSVMKVIKDVKQILFYETVSSTTPEFRPNAYVDITKYIDFKIKSIQAHKTQSHRLYMHPNAARSLANTRYIWGKIGSDPNGFAEAFRIHKMIL
jgi:LmbE family N-acetylglucosaminyl deacetylase